MAFIDPVSVVDKLIKGAIVTTKVTKKAIKAIKDTKQEMDTRKREKEYKEQVEQENRKFEADNLKEIDKL